jgi:DNA replication protein DnaC
MEKFSDLLPEFRRKHLRIVDGNTVREPRLPEPSYTCQKCHDVGYVRADVPYGHEAFGKAIKCTCTEAREKIEKQQALESMSGVMHYDRYKDADFEHFQKRLPGVKEAYNAAFTFAHDPDGWLALVGPFGCGKTHLAVAIAKVRLAAGASVLVQTVPDLLDNLRTTFDPRAEVLSFNDLFDHMKTADLLVLDDYGAENTTPWAVEKLFQILNYRYNMALPTVITTNNIGLEGIDPRVRSRLSDTGLVNVVHMLEAQDYRPNQQKKAKVVSDVQ